MEHICELHGEEFTAKTGKEGDTFWSHKTEDGWCNEKPKGGKQPATKKKADDMSKDDWAEKDRIKQTSIETQNAFSGVVELIKGGVINKDEPLARAAINYAAGKLSNWYSQGSDIQVKVPQPTQEQRKRMAAALKKWDAKEAQDLLIERWETNETKHLNSEQMEDFINQLEKGIKAQSIEPDSIPF